MNGAYCSLSGLLSDLQPTALRILSMAWQEQLTPKVPKDEIIRSYGQRQCASLIA